MLQGYANVLPSPTPMKKLSPTHLKCLKLVGTLGFLTTRQLAMLAFAHLSPASALSSAQTAAMYLRKRNFLIARPLHTTHHTQEARAKAKASGDDLKGPLAYVLTSPGAELLNELSMDDWVNDEDATMLWYADGYNLSLADCETRHPLIVLLHEALKRYQDGEVYPVGPRGLKRGVDGLSRVAHFDAVLVKPTGKVAVSCYLARPTVAVAGDQVRQLAKGNYRFLIAADTPSKLKALMSTRARINPPMDELLHEQFAGLYA